MNTESTTREIFERSTAVEVPASELYAWHTRPGAFERLSPPWERVRVVESSGGLSEGSRVALEVGVGPLKTRWVARHRDVRESEGFSDIQEQGPFAAWEHAHEMLPSDDGGSILHDRVEFAMPFGALGRLFGLGMVRGKLDGMFRYRHRITREDLKTHSKRETNRPMKIVITGSSGLVGGALVPFLTTGGHEVVRLVRDGLKPRAKVAFWDPAGGRLDPAVFDGADAVVHLAGENIAARRWTGARKRRIRDSRVQGTKLLAETLALCSSPPSVLVSGSAVGYYGDAGDAELTEDSPAGSGFLADVCKEWEQAADPARAKGIRVAHLRTGMVLSPAGGALARLLTPFRLGAGGRLGSGEQYVSWIAIDDLVYAIHHIIDNASLEGPVNAVSPNPVTNAEFTRTLGRVLSRPTVLPMPAFAARLAFGELADELLLASQRVLPRHLERSGYDFRFPRLEDALSHLLGKSLEDRAAS